MKNIELIIEVAKELKVWHFSQVVGLLKVNGISGSDIAQIMKKLKTKEPLLMS